MSRPIEFRIVWETKNGPVIANELTIQDIHNEIDGSPPYDFIEQYTGLKDKKRTEEFPEGQKIFEGDKVKDGRGVIRVCEWIHGGFVFREDMRNYIFANNECEVIGNIHEGE